jgi:molecular chaperone DnaK
MISKNTTIPTEKKQVFSTASDNQPSVEVHVLQGERPMASDNKTLARFILDGIPPAPRGVPQIEVTFDIDANGILNVKAHDKGTGKEQSVKIEATTSLSKEKIEELKREAEINAEEDNKKKELIEARNQAESLIYVAEKSLKDSGDKVSEDAKKSINENIDQLKKSKEGNDLEKIKSDTENLSKEIQKIGQGMYEDNKSSSGDKEGKVVDEQEGKDDNKEKKDSSEDNS